MRMTSNEELLLEEAAKNETINVEAIASPRMIDVQELLRTAEEMVRRGLLDFVSKGVFKIVPIRGQQAWAAMEASDRAEVLRRSGYWGRAA
jgi:predicted transcriptional regulator of viral defense system